MEASFKQLKNTIKSISSLKLTKLVQYKLKVNLLQLILTCLDSLISLGFSEKEENLLLDVKKDICSISNATLKTYRMNESLPTKFNFVGSNISEDDSVYDFIQEVNDSAVTIKNELNLSDSEYEKYAKATVDRIISGEYLKDQQNGSSGGEDEFQDSY